MKFDDLDRRMRVYETQQDFCVPPGLFMVARVDGRGFTRRFSFLQKIAALLSVGADIRGLREKRDGVSRRG